MNTTINKNFSEVSDFFAGFGIDFNACHDLKEGKNRVPNTAVQDKKERGKVAFFIKSFADGNVLLTINHFKKGSGKLLLTSSKKEEVNKPRPKLVTTKVKTSEEDEKEFDTKLNTFNRWTNEFNSLPCVTTKNHFGYLKNKNVIDIAIASNLDVRCGIDNYGHFIMYPFTNGEVVTGYQKIYDSKVLPGGRNKDFRFYPKMDGGHSVATKKNGSYAVIGDLASSDSIFVVEGLSTGLSVYGATGTPTIVAIDAGNIKNVVAKFHTTKQVMIAADFDANKFATGQKTAAAVAKEFNCSYILPAHTDKSVDFNDVHCEWGLEEVKRQLSENLVTPTIAAAGKFDLKFIPCDQHQFNVDLRTYIEQGLPQSEIIRELTAKHPAISGIDIRVKRALTSIWDITLDSTKWIDLPIELVKSNRSILVQAPLGSGKTEAVKRVIESNAFDKVIYISPSKALCADASKRLNSTLYSDIDSESWPAQKRLVICVPSLSKQDDNGNFLFSNIKNALVVIDESEQSIGMLTSDIIPNDKANDLINIFQSLIRNNHVIALDAFLGQRTINFFKNQGVSPLMIQSKKLESKNRRVIRYAHPDDIERAVIKRLKKGGKAAVACGIEESKLIYERVLRAGLNPDEVVLINKENAGESEHILRDCTKYIDEHHIKCFIYSPVISSGVSITSKGFEMFGIFYNTKLTPPPTVAMQMMGRFRENGITWHIFYSDAWLLPKSRQDIEEQRALAIAKTKVLVKRVGNEWIPSFEEEAIKFSEFDNQFVENLIIDSNERSKASDYFFWLVAEYGWEFTKGNNLINLASRKERKEIRDSIKDAEIKAILNSDTITLDESIAIKSAIDNGQVVSQDEKHSLKRYQIEDFTKMSISKDLIELWNNDLFGKVNLRIDADTTGVELTKKELKKLERDIQFGTVSRHKWASVNGYVSKILMNKFQPGTELTKDCELVNELIEFAQHNKGYFTDVFQLNKNFEQKPLQNIREFLEKIGRSITLSKTVQGKRYYQVEENLLIKEVTEKRKEFMASNKDATGCNLSSTYIDILDGVAPCEYFVENSAGCGVTEKSVITSMAITTQKENDGLAINVMTVEIPAWCTMSPPDDISFDYHSDDESTSTSLGNDIPSTLFHDDVAFWHEKTRRLSYQRRVELARKYELVYKTSCRRDANLMILNEVA